MDLLDELPESAQQWAHEQFAKTETRKSSMTRDDYYSVLNDLYRKLNPPAASGLTRIVRESHPSIEWLDRAIVLNRALLASLDEEPPPRR